MCSNIMLAIVYLDQHRGKVKSVQAEVIFLRVLSFIYGHTINVWDTWLFNHLALFLTSNKK